MDIACCSWLLDSHVGVETCVVGFILVPIALSLDIRAGLSSTFVCDIAHMGRRQVKRREGGIRSSVAARARSHPSQRRTTQKQAFPAQASSPQSIAALGKTEPSISLAFADKSTWVHDDISGLARLTKR